MNDKSPIRVLISYDQSLVGEGLVAILSKQKDMSVVEFFENDLSGNRKIANYAVDIFILEFSNWNIQCYEYVKSVRESSPGLKILIISEIITHRLLEALMRYVNGYVLRTCSSETVVFAIREIFISGKYLCSREIDILFGGSQDCDVEVELTSREREILANWLISRDNNELAKSLNISHSTVRTHLKNIRQKLGAISHIQLMNYACRENILMGRFKPLCNYCKAYSSR